MTAKHFSIAAFAAVLMTGPVWAQELFIYPAEGQSDEQLEQDKFACYQFAKKNTGVDPMQTPTTGAAPPAQAQGGSVAKDAGKGALGGAALGGVVGAIAGDTKKGLAIGAASGGLLGGGRSYGTRKRSRQAQEQAAQQEASNQAAARSNYNRAYAACLEGRGYTVK